MLFSDHDRQLTISDGRRTARMSRAQFQLLEPDYQPDPAVVTRHLTTEVYWTSDGANQQPAADIPRAQIEGYIAKVRIYQRQFPGSPPEQPPEQALEPNWAGLESALRGSSIWGKAYDAASRSVRANAAFTLVLATLTTTYSLNDLRFGWYQLRACLRDQAALQDWSAEELALVGEKLAACGFDPTQFDLEVR